MQLNKIKRPDIHRAYYQTGLKLINELLGSSFSTKYSKRLDL